MRTKLIVTTLLILCFALLTWFIWAAVGKVNVIDRTDPKSLYEAPTPATEQMDVLENTDPVSTEAKPVNKPSTEKVQQIESQHTENQNQYPGGYSYTCPAGSYPIGDGVCKQEPSYCADGSESEKCDGQGL